MRHAWVLVALVAAMMALTSACRHTEIVVVTATPGPPPTPTQTYNQWLGGQIALAMCRDPDHILTYHNERRSPPYQANFVCESPTSIPDAAATQVAATVTAASPPTRPPRATLTPTRPPHATPRPTLAPVSTPTPWPTAPQTKPTPAWRSTPTPTPSARESINCEHVEDEGITRCYGDGAPNFEAWASAVRDLDWECPSGQPPAYSNEVRSPPFQADILCEGHLKPLDDLTAQVAPYRPPPPETIYASALDTAWLEYYHPDIHRRITNFPWVRDGLTDQEVRAFKKLALEYGRNEFVRTLLEFPWVQDDVTPNEWTAIWSISYMGSRNKEITDQLITMPFLQQREMGTQEARLVRTIDVLIQQSDWDGEYLQEGQEATKMLRAFFTHNAVRDGITADEVRLAWTALLIEDADEMLRFLTPGYATVESEQIATTFSPDMKISIVRVHSKRDPDTLRKVTGSHRESHTLETIMGQRLPVDEVVLILHRAAVSEGAAGTNLQYAISYLPGYEGSQDLWAQDTFQSGILHEVAHYFWGHPSWLAEGIADTLKWIYNTETPGVAQRTNPGTLEPERDSCRARNLAELARDDPNHKSPEFSCNYFLGQKLFQELYENLGRAEFGARLQELYRALEQRWSDEGSGEEIEDVRDAFNDLSHIVESHWSGNAADKKQVLWTGGHSRMAAVITYRVSPDWTEEDWLYYQHDETGAPCVTEFHSAGGRSVPAGRTSLTANTPAGWTNTTGISTSKPKVRPTGPLPSKNPIHSTNPSPRSAP